MPGEHRESQKAKVGLALAHGWPVPGWACENALRGLAALNPLDPTNRAVLPLRHFELPRLASGADDHAIIVWDLESARALLRWTGHERFAGALAYSPVGSLLASVQGDTETAGAVRLWHAQTGALRRELDGHVAGVHVAAFDSTGRRLAIGDSNGVLISSDVNTGRILRGEVVGPSWVWSIAFVDDDRRLVTLVLRDAESLEPVLTFPPWTGMVKDLAFDFETKFVCLKNQASCAPRFFWSRFFIRARIHR